MQNLVGVIGVADLLDILVVAILVYTAVVWVRRTQAGFVAIGLFVLAGLYVLAEALDLQLTTAIFRSVFAISVVLIVVLFQEELRQLFERLGVWSVRGRRRRLQAAARSLPADILVESVADFTRQRRGALIVLPGIQPLARHVRGGVPLDGLVSVPLLQSLFDPHSAGHDGAVILEGDRITRFAAHLPLSTNFQLLRGVGTRHGAALGLAELTDALCIVVSEERGVISVARDADLRVLSAPGELSAHIDQFLAETRPTTNERASFWRQLVREHWVEKAASLVFVVALWMAVVPGARPLERSFQVPVEFTNLPPGVEVKEVTPAEVGITLSGRRRDFYLFAPRFLRVTIDAALVSQGRRTFQVLGRDVRYPQSLTLEDIEPDEVKISVRKVEPQAES
jgi:diadenylate cyclase